MKNKFFKMSDIHDDQKVNESIDSFVCRSIEDALRLGGACTEYSYSVGDLDRLVNEGETLREYILDSIAEFSLPAVDLGCVTDCQLDRIVMQCDDAWRAALNGGTP